MTEIERRALEDLIPDPNDEDNLLHFGNNKLLVKILSSVAASQAQNTETTKALVHQMDNIDATLEKLVEYYHEAKLYQQAVDNRFNIQDNRISDRKKEIAEILEVAKEAKKMATDLEKEMHTSCDVTSQSIHKTTDKKLESLKTGAKYTIGIVATLVTYIFLTQQAEVKEIASYLHKHLEEKH